jgi:radical SAM superfamily enzyme YgiQ (UPF0313 family)
MYEPDLVGVSIVSAELDNLRPLLGKIKAGRPSVVTLAGGLHATLFDDLLLGEVPEEVPELDLVLRGEADLSFP